MNLLRRTLTTAKSTSRRFSKQILLHRRQRLRLRKHEQLFGVNDLLKDPANKPYQNEINSYWRDHFGRPVHPLWHIACAKVTGIKDVRYIPDREWRGEILPFFNDLPLLAAFRDKNLSDVFLNFPQAPQTIIKRMHGQYYAGDNTPMSIAAVEQRLTAGQKDMIVKPSQTDDGYGIRSLVVREPKLFLNDCPCTLSDLETSHGRNFIVQEKIIQHPLMAQVHPDSVNTIRMVTFRWKNEIRMLIAFARFGSHGKLTDNAGTGGLCCGIDEQGKLNDSAVDVAGMVYSRHPTTGYSFANRISNRTTIVSANSYWICTDKYFISILFPGISPSAIRANRFFSK